MTDRKRPRVTYIREMAAELAKMAREDRLPTLAQLLEIAALEANDSEAPTPDKRRA